MRAPPYWTLLLLSTCSPQEFVVGSGESPVEPFSVTRLRLEWATPHQLRWAWDSSGQPSSFDGFRLVVGPSPADVEVVSSSCRIITATENVELAQWFLPGSQGPARTLGTTTTHLPETRWFAQLHWSSDGEPAVSNLASGSTSSSPSGQLIIFQDSPAAPYTIPESFALSSAGPYAGTSAYEYSSTCIEADSCWENLRLADMDFDLSGVPEAALASTAYIEFALAYRGATASYWSELFLQFTDCKPCRYGFVGWTIAADDAYRVYQVPLSALQDAGQAVPPSALRSRLSELRVGGNWAEGGHVRLDEVSLRW